MVLNLFFESRLGGPTGKYLVDTFVQLKVTKTIFYNNNNS